MFFNDIFLHSFSRMRQLGHGHIDPNADQEEEAGRRISGNQSNDGNDTGDEERIYEQVNSIRFDP